MLSGLIMWIWMMMTMMWGERVTKNWVNSVVMEQTFEKPEGRRDGWICGREGNP